ncbi:hypothetical protein B0T24DRAFT_714360 [Lasiosphaeria ovina]|uniref:Uncharacterized protein n=1 Tax=Lasiosphaeria ovina TaxID=92902 RepID=A0AAE0NIQ1_9PEZI|nr:hypothetical protein B0T24DRAFT_714360 [Lasiosphaeria ovina]
MPRGNRAPAAGPDSTRPTIEEPVGRQPPPIRRYRNGTVVQRPLRGGSESFEPDAARVAKTAEAATAPQAGPSEASAFSQRLELVISQRKETQPAFLAAELPAKNKAGFLEMLPAVAYDGTWSVHDEDRLREEWETHPIKLAIDYRVEPKKDRARDDRILWKATCQFLDCLPTDIISIDEEMMFDSGTERQRAVPSLTGPDASDAAWPRAFCRALYQLLLHPAWERQPDLLRIAVQYTVICATDDVRPWLTYCDVYDPFLKRFLHRAGLFSAIEEQTSESRLAARNAGLTLRPDGGDRAPYLVRTSDLTHLASAIETADMVYGGAAPWTPKLWTQASRLTSRNRGSGYPDDVSMGRGLNAVWLHIVRRGRRKERLATERPSEGLSLLAVGRNDEEGSSLDGVDDGLDGVDDGLEDNGHGNDESDDDNYDASVDRSNAAPAFPIFGIAAVPGTMAILTLARSR